MDLTTATPAEIDTELDKLQFETASAENMLRGLTARAADYRKVASEQTMDHYIRRYTETAEEYEAKIPAATAALDEALLAEVPFHAEYHRRGGWTRAFLVITSGSGHVHRTTSCSTCYPSTTFVRMSTYSGLDEQAIVDDAGERACTVCYASAPVELRLDRPTKMFSSDEVAAQAARAERDAARAAKKAAEIEVPEFQESYRSSKGKTFKSARAVTNAIAGELTTLVWLGPDAVHEANVKACREALEAKGIDYDYDKALANARKSFTRNSGRPAKF